MLTPMGKGMTLKEEALWLVEATRYLEEAQGVGEETTALAAARKAEISIEGKIARRAEYLPSASQLLVERRALMRVFKLSIAFALVLFLVLGAFAAGAAFVVKDGHFVNIYWLLSSLLGIHILSLIIWLGGLAFGSGGLLGHLVSDISFSIARRVNSNSIRLAAVRAMMKRYVRGKGGLWLSSALSHGLWGAYLFGAMVAIFALLATQRYVFIWETTILSSQSYEALTHILSALPAQLGILVPGADIVRASEWPLNGDVSPGAHLLWSNFLFAVLLLYGLVPRILLCALSVFLARRYRRRSELDLSRPLYARLVPLLHPVVSKTDIVDEDDEGRVTENVTAQDPDIPVLEAEKTALLGWEIDKPEHGWPPSSFKGLDLGIFDERAQLADKLSQAQSRERLVVVLSATLSPDRGVGAVLSQCIQAMDRNRVFVWMVGAHQVKQKYGDAFMEARLGDWLSTAYQAGVSERHFLVAEWGDRAAQKILGDGQ